MSKIILDASCDPYRDKIELAIRIFSPLAPGIEEIPCTIIVECQEGINGRLGDLNGCMIAPESDGLPFTILIAERQLRDSQYIHTLVHELMHLLDYSQFAKEYGSQNTLSPHEKERLHSWEFYLWAEFHAKQVGFWFYCLYTWHECGYETPPDGRYSFENVDWQTKSVEEPLDMFLAGRTSASANKHLWDTILALVNYYARMSIAEGVDENSFPDPAFPREKLVSAFGEDALELFPLLRRMHSYAEAIPLLPALAALFDRIVAKLNAESPWAALRSIQFDQFSALQQQMRRLIDSVTLQPPMTEAVKSIIQSMSALKIPESLARSLSRADAIKSCVDNIPSLKATLDIYGNDDKKKATGPGPKGRGPREEKDTP